MNVKSIAKYFGFFILGGVFFLSVAFLLGKHYEESNNDARWSLFEIQYETQFIKYQFTEAYCNNRLDDDTVSLLNNLISSYLYQYNNDIEMTDLEIHLSIAMYRLSKVYSVLGQNQLSSRVSSIASRFSVLDGAPFEVDLEVHDKKLCSKPNNAPLP